MAVTQQQVDAAFANIVRHLEAYRGAPDSVWDLQRCLAALQWLREQYRLDKSVLAAYVDRLRDLSGQIHEAMAARREALTAQYLDALGAVAAWEGIREACRDALVELSAAQKTDRLECPQGWVEVRRTKSLSLPKTGTPQREELAALLTEAGRWADVAYPSPARLLKALEGGLFSPQQAGEMARLCPTHETPRLIAHANNK